MTTDPNLTRAIDAVSFWRAKVARRFHKNAKKIATWNLWVAEDRAQHVAQAIRDNTVSDYNGPNPIDFPLPYYRGSQTEAEIDEED